jgi:hypothetical protein
MSFYHTEELHIFLSLPYRLRNVTLITRYDHVVRMQVNHKIFFQKSQSMLQHYVCSLVGVYTTFSGEVTLALKMEAAYSKCWYPSIRLCDFKTQKPITIYVTTKPNILLS